MKKDINLKFYNLIKNFYEESGVPVLLNTSFNIKGQPIVNTPKEAVETFKSTKIDVLAIGDYLLTKSKTYKFDLILKFKNMIIKLFTYYYTNNYGALLQSLCLKSIIEENFDSRVEYNSYQQKDLILRKHTGP